MAIIETRDLSQRYGERYTLKNVNLSIEPGEVFVIVGPTGSGKTTLLRLIDLLDTPVSGKIFFAGTDVTYSRKPRFTARRRMSFVQQKPVVFNMSVFDNVACSLRWRREKNSLTQHKVASVLQLVDMAQYGQRNARTLSGGETQRVAIARALVTEPELLLLDEPTANLDPLSTTKIEEVLGHIIHQHRITVIMSTHDMLQGQRLAGRIGVLSDGALLQVGDVNDVFTLPATRAVAEFIGMDNILPGTISEKEDNLATIKINRGEGLIQGLSDFKIGTAVHILIRPEDIFLALLPTASSARNSFNSKVVGIIPRGPLVQIKLDCGFPLLALITRRSVEEMNISPGKFVYASFKATAVRTIQRWS